MWGGKNKRRKPVDAHGGSPARKKGGIVNKDTSVQKNVGVVKECEVALNANQTNRNTPGVVIEGEGWSVAMASRELVADMEYENQTMSDENSEGEVVSEEEKRSSEKSSSTASFEFPEEERIRRQIREKNLTKHRMVKTRRGLIYEADLTEEDRKYLGKQDDEYKYSHIGFKVVEASLIPSVRDNNNEANNSMILGYVYSQGYKVMEVKESGYGRVDLVFDNYHEANKCFRDKGEEGGTGKFINFSIPNRSKRSKGIGLK